MRRSLPHVLRLAAFGLLCLGLWWGQQRLGWELDPQSLREVEAAWSPSWIGAYLLFWIVGNTVLWPTLAGGVLYGWIGGTLLGLLGAALAAAAQLVVIRTFLRAPAEAWLGARLVPLQRLLQDRGLALLVLWRLLWLPVSWITVAAALSHVPLWQHVVAVIAMAPGMVALTLMADGLVLHGPMGLPPERWAVLIGTFAVSLGVWWLAQRTWPALRLEPRSPRP